MSIKWLRAGVCCDGCAKTFMVDIELATTVTMFALQHNWSLYEYAEDAIRGGAVVTERPVGKVGKITEISGLAGSSSIQADKQLCPSCTEIVDQIGDDGYLPTADEITKALEAKIGSAA